MFLPFSLKIGHIALDITNYPELEDKKIAGSYSQDIARNWEDVKQIVDGQIAKFQSELGRDPLGRDPKMKLIKEILCRKHMEELCRKHNEAINDGRQPTFPLADFEKINLFEVYVSRAGVIGSNEDSVILDALLEYERRGYYKIENDMVNLTESGLAECQKPVHDWG